MIKVWRGLKAWFIETLNDPMAWLFMGYVIVMVAIDQYSHTASWIWTGVCVMACGVVGIVEKRRP